MNCIVIYDIYNLRNLDIYKRIFSPKTLARYTKRNAMKYIEVCVRLNIKCV